MAVTAESCISTTLAFLGEHTCFLALQVDLQVDRSNRVLTLLQVQRRLGLDMVGPMAPKALAEAALQVLHALPHHSQRYLCSPVRASVAPSL